MKTIVNSGFYQILGTDRFVNTEPSDEEYLAYRRKWAEYPEKRIVGEFPLHIDTESTNGCNLKCVMCSRNFMTEKIGNMDLGLYKKIIDEGADYKLPSIKLNFRGEPLLHPELGKMVKYAKDKGIMEVQFNSNGMLLTEKKSEELIKAGLDRIIFSVDGATAQTYNAIRRGADYGTVVTNIKRLIKMRNDLGLKKPFVRVQMVKMKETENEVEQFILNWRDVANRIAFLGKREPFEKCGVLPRSLEHFACYQVWQRIVVWWDSTVVMCCGDWHGGYILGNANDTSIYDLWHGAKYQKIRDMHAEARFNDHPMCARCEVNTPLEDPALEQTLAKYGYKPPAK